MLNPIAVIFIAVGILLAIAGIYRFSRHSTFGLPLCIVGLISITVPFVASLSLGPNP